MMFRRRRTQRRAAAAAAVAADRRRTLSRRAFLGGAGAAIALPWMESLAPTLARAAATPGPPKRFLGYFVPNGMHMPSWTPTTVGAGYDLPPILASLIGVRDKVNVLTGLSNKAAIVPVAGDHARGTAAFLTCMTASKTEGADISLGISVDQVAANALGDGTPFRSLQLSTTQALSIGSCDSGYACAYQRNISWAGPSTPLPKIAKPRVLFDRLFAGLDPAATVEELARRRLLRTSVLDYALDDARRLQTRLGASDRHKLDEYLTSVEEVEKRIQQAADAPLCEAPDRPPETLPFPEHVALMTDLMVLAFRCDMTRFMTFMLGDGGSNRGYEFLGVSGAHHQISHHQKDPDNLARLETIDTWEVEQLARLLHGLDAVVEADGQTLLDHTLVVFGSEIEDGDSHSHLNMPLLLAGGAGMGISSGRHLVYEEQEPVADLYLALLAALGVQTETFGSDGTRALPGLV